MGTAFVFKCSMLQFDAFIKDTDIKNMFFFGNPFWVSLWSCILHAFCFIFRSSLSNSGENCGEMVGSDLDGTVCEKPDVGIDDEVGNSSSEVESVSNANTSKYEFISGNSLCAFIEEPEIMSVTIKEMFVLSNQESPNQDNLLEELASSKNDFPSVNSIAVSSCLDETVDDCVELSEKKVAVNQGKTEHSDCGLNFGEQESVNYTEHDVCNEGEISNVEERIMSDHEYCDEVRSSVSNSDDFWASIHKFDYFSDDNNVSDSDSDEIMCDKIPVKALEPETPIGVGDTKDTPKSLDDFLLVQNSLHLASFNAEGELDDSDFRYIEIEPQSVLKSDDSFEEHVSRDEFSDSEDEFEQENSSFDELKGIDASESSDGEGDQTGMDVLLEQKELIRQMKKEMRNLKISGLPTILEESESPRVEDDLRPLKINERIGHKDRMDEIQTLYKKYLDKMRKLDILSQQTMYAIGLLQLKNQDEISSNKKISVPVIKSLLAQNFWSYKLRKHETEPVQKLIRDFQMDLEVAYVGQLCLSWEILKWQHHKSEELLAYDPDGFRQHNQVAGEFQKFQVLLQRFTEDEPFHHGPRIQHYVKSRCILPNLLQVPLIKDDSRGEWRGKGEGGISIKMLKEVITASMRAFWEFLHADKDEVLATTLMNIHGVHIELQDPSDTELLTEVRSNLQKKEKRLKDLIKSGNCIVRKFQKHQDQRLSHEMFLARVELRLVSRVLTMSRLTTDQLLWCHKKISKINIAGRKVYLDPSFLLFPC